MAKLKSSTLLETLVATVIILIIFFISGLIINNLAKNTIQNNHHNVEAELKRIGYFCSNGKIDLPYEIEYENWNILVIESKETDVIEIDAWQKNGDKTLKKSVYAVE